LRASNIQTTVTEGASQLSATVSSGLLAEPFNLSYRFAPAYAAAGGPGARGRTASGWSR
jgi:hypothetical protein